VASQIPLIIHGSICSVQQRIKMNVWKCGFVSRKFSMTNNFIRVKLVFFQPVFVIHGRISRR
jgi:hypothetical protein